MTGIQLSCRAWLSARGILQGSGSDAEHIEAIDEGLLASLLLVLQQLPSLITSAPKMDLTSRVREALTQVRLNLLCELEQLES